MVTSQMSHFHSFRAISFLSEGIEDKGYTKMLHNICTIEWKYYVIHDMLLSRFWVRDVQETSEIQLKFTIPAILPSLTSSKDEYLRVVRIHSDG